MGTYLSEPRGPDARKIKTRSLKYRLSSDGVLVGKHEDQESSCDKPVLPNVPFDSSLKDAPCSMTWKHVLLAAVHNTATGCHRKASDMARELGQLVTWWPPEDLKKGLCYLDRAVQVMHGGKSNAAGRATIPGSERV